MAKFHQAAGCRSTSRTAEYDRPQGRAPAAFDRPGRTPTPGRPSRAPRRRAAGSPARLGGREPLPERRVRHRRDVEAPRLEQADEALHPGRQRLAERRVAGQRVVLEPQAVDDERAGRPVELRVEAADQPVAPQDRHRVVAERSLLDRLVDLPDVVEAEQRLRPTARADRIERREERRLLVGRRLERRPVGRAPGPPRGRRGSAASAPSATCVARQPSTRTSIRVPSASQRSRQAASSAALALCPYAYMVAMPFSRVSPSAATRLAQQDVVRLASRRPRAGPRLARPPRSAHRPVRSGRAG